ncbi:MAG: ABC transporter substrate-binding protein [Solirubrobacterales bacterium]
MKRILAVLITFIMCLSLIGCGKKADIKSTTAVDKNWDTILEDSKGTTVNFYGWGGSETTNRWIDEYLAKTVKEKYNITLKRVPMNIDDILNKLLADKQGDNKNGTIDIVWINGENFYTAKKADLLFGPFTSKMPNFTKYVDSNSDEVKKDFGYTTDGYESPYGKAQFVMVYNSNKISKTPVNAGELMEFAKANPGKFTYSAPPDFTGSAFVRNIIYETVGYDKIANVKADKESVKAAIQPAMDYLKELKPYLWNQGKSYPASISQLDNMYADNQLLMTMTYSSNSISGKIANGEYPKGTKSFILEKGTIGNTHFLAIPFNSTNKEGAMAVINEVLSVEAQAAKYDPKGWGDLPVLDNSKLSSDEKKQFESIALGEGVLPQETLLKHRVPEIPANLVPIIEEIWQEQIPGDK